MTLRKWHNRVGLVAALVLLVIALSGTLLVFKGGLTRLLVTGFEPLPDDYGIEQMAGELERIHQRFPPGQVELLKAPNAEDAWWMIHGREAGVVLLTPGTLEPYTRNAWLPNALEVVRHLHTELLMGLTGEILIWLAAVTALFLLVSGIILWWPIKRSFRWRWAFPRRVPPRQLLANHRHMGAVLLLFLVPLIRTGATMLTLTLSAVFSQTPATPPALHQPLPGTAAPPGQIVHNAAAAVPDGWPTYITLPDSAAGTAEVRLRLPGEWHPNGRTRVTLDAAGAEVSAVSRADQAAPGRRLLNQMYPLHSGFGLPVLYSLLVFAGGLGLAWLCYSGAASWIAKRLPDMGQVAPRSETGLGEHLSSE